MRKILLALVLVVGIAFAGSFEESFKIYSKDADDLYMNAMSAINQSDKYEIIETQSKNGYILFLYGARYYLLTLTRRYQNQTEIKILPQNSDFSQGSIVAKDIFALIDRQLIVQPMEQIK